MALDVGVLRARLVLDRETFDGDLRRAEQQFRGLGQSGERAGRQASSGFGGISRSVRQETDQAERQFRSLGQTGQQTGQRIGQGIQSGAASGLRGIAGQASAAGAQAGGATGTAMAGGIASRLGAASGAGGPIGVAVMAVATIGAAAGKLLADNIIQGMTIQAQRGQDAARFGWTPEQAAEAGAAAAGAYGNAWGDSVAKNREAAGIAIQAGLLNGNATADQMQPVIEKLATITKTMGTDVPATAKAAGQMIKTGLVKDSSEAFDLLQRAQEKGLNLDGDLLETVNEYSTQWRGMGIDGATALGTIQQMMTAGARDTDIAADALKEFRVRVTDVGDSGATAALQSLGLPVDEFRAKITAGGQDAMGASQTIIMALAQVGDVTKRNELGLALMGTQWEDLAGAINGLDLSKGRETFGAYAGAVGEAQKKMGGAAADIQAAKNTLSNAADDVKVKLAEAFGPSIGEGAKWISDNIDLITGALKQTAGTAAAFGGAAITAFGGALWAVGKVTEAIAGMIEAFIRSQAVMGGLIAKIPGLGDVGRGIQDAANKAADFAGKFREGGAAAADLGGKMTSAGTKIAESGIKLAFSKSEAEKTTEAFGRLGVKVEQTPDGKFIQVTDNSPEAVQRLSDLGLKVRTLPDGKVVIDAQDEAARIKIRDIIKTETKRINVELNAPAVRTVAVVGTGQSVSTDAQGNRGGVPDRANGGIVAMAGGGLRQIAKPQSAGIYAGRGAGTIFAEEETGGEAYIPLAGSKRGRSTAILAEVARLFGMDLVGPTQSFAEGGLRTAAAINDFPRAGGLEGSPYVWGGVNWGDCSGAMSAIANFAVGLAPFASRFATGSEGAELAKRGFKTGRGPAGSLRFGWVNGGPGGGHTAGTLPDGTNVEMGGGRGNGQVGGKAAGADDPQFTDHAYLPLGDSGQTTGSPSQAMVDAATQQVNAAQTSLEQARQRQQALGRDAKPEDVQNAAALVAAGESTLTAAQAKLDQLQSKAAGSDSTSTSAAPSGEQRVYVTNWPTGLGDTQSSSAGVKFSLFANGGIEDHTAHITDKLRVFGEPETGGEAYIPLAPSKRARSLAIWHQTGKRLGVNAFAAGGIAAPKIEAPKIDVKAPTLGPGMAVPIADGAGAPQLADSQAPAATFDGAKYTQERAMQFGMQMLEITRNAAVEIGVPGGALPSLLTNSVGLAKSIGEGLQSSQQNQRTETASSGSQNGGNQVVNNVTINATNTDDAFRQWQTKQNRDAAAFEGKLP